jgi:hypothetical protein
MPCTPKKTLRAIKDSGNCGLVQIKENQKQLLDDCRATTRGDAPTASFSAPLEKGRGRIEQRSVRVFSCNYTTDPEWQPLIAEIIEVQRKREVLNTKTNQWETSEETAIYISTHPHTAEEYHHAIRNHWAIENRLHRVRDGSMHEDASRIRKNPSIMARCRSFALNILRANHVTNIHQTRYQNALNLNNLTQYQYLYS